MQKSRGAGARRPLRWAAMLALGTAIAGAGGQPALAQPGTAAAAATAEQRRFDLDIPGSDLGSALLALGTAVELRVFFEPQRFNGLRSPGLRGRFTAAQALDRLLEHTGFTYVFTGPSAVRLEARPASAPQQRHATPVGPGASDAPGVTLPQVEVRAVSEEEQQRDLPYRTAGSRSVLSRDDIERSRGTSVGDIFRGTPGVLVGENRNSGGLDVNIRGMQGQGRVPVLVDGARQETTVYRGYSGVASRSYVDPDLIGGIQIDKGPTMSAQGTGAIGGLVTMRTLNADDIVQPGSTFGLRVRGQAIGNNSGSAVAPDTPAGLYTGGVSGQAPVYRTDCLIASLCGGRHALPEDFGFAEGMDRPSTLASRSWAGSLAIAKRWERIDLVAAYAERHQGNYHAGTHGPAAYVDLSDRRRLPFYTEVRPVIRGASSFQAGERIPGTHYASESALLKTRLYLPAEQELELSYLRYSSLYSEIMPSQITRFANFGPIVQPRNSEVTADTVSSRYEWKPDDNPWIDLRANLWHTRTRATNNSPSINIPGLYNNERETYRRWGLDLSNTSTRQHGPWGESQFRYGVAAQWENVGSQSLAPDDRLAGRSGDRDEVSAFAAWQYKPISSVTFDAGLRYSRFKVSDDNPITIRDPRSPDCVDANGDGDCDPLPNRNARSGTTPVVSLSWEPGNRGLQFYARYAEAMRMPSLFESTSGFSFEAAPDVILKPEHTRNKEIGVNFLKDGVLGTRDRLRLKLALFRNHTTDYLTRTSPNLWEQGGANNTLGSNFTMRNVDSVRLHGLELSGAYDLGLVFTEFGATKYNHVEVCHTGSYRIHRCNDYGIANSYINNMIPPQWHATLGLGTRLLKGRLVMGVRGTFMGQRNNAPRFNDDTSLGFLSIVPWHRYKVFDLYASYRVSERVKLDFNVDNFTDRYYLDALGLGLIPAPGRSARLSVTLQF